jgi:uncharacterized protein YutE (UPF0331/DUF86 family)
LVDRDTLDRRLAKLEQLVRDLRALAATPRDLYLRDRGRQAQAERWLQIAVECTLDLANHLIADRGWQTPATYREAFAILEREGVLRPELAAHMQGWAGLRNLLTHLYLDIDHERVYAVLTEELDDLVHYAASIVRAAR